VKSGLSEEIVSDEGELTYSIVLTLYGHIDIEPWPVLSHKRGIFLGDGLLRVVLLYCMVSEVRCSTFKFTVLFIVLHTYMRLS
jgi:hypothetical protein